MMDDGGKTPSGFDPGLAVLMHLQTSLDLAPAGSVLCAELELPAGSIDALLSQLPERVSVVWSAPDVQVVGLGEAWACTLQGPERFDALKLAAADFFKAVEPLWPDADRHLRCLGGFAFQPGGSEELPWQEGADGRFVIPRWMLRQQGQQVILTVCAAAAVDNTALLDEYRALRQAWLAPVPSLEVDPALTDFGMERLPEQHWADMLSSIAGLFEAGEAQKVVAARRTTLSFHAPLRWSAVVSRLRRDNPTCVTYAFPIGPRWFVGATPERLVSHRQGVLETEALAGSIRPGSVVDQQRLLDSLKDQVEHRLVVEDIQRCLSPLCEELHFSDQPEIRVLKHVLHLRTPVTGKLNARAHILDLVEALHPTPAVGGTPRPVAVRWIQSHEPAPRGWYAGPVGWFDAASAGDFMVALRCGVLSDATAWLYAGAGIVPGSDAALEYAETRLKFKTMLAAVTGLEADVT